MSTGAARAEQRRDYMLDFQPEGTRFIIDYFGTGAMFTLEHRLSIYSKTNDFTLAAALIPSYPLTEAHARADLRILFLGLGATVGYRAVWRDLVFEPGEDGAYCLRCDREARRDKDEWFGETPGSDTWGFAEARANLYLPLNEHLVGVSTAAIRYEARRDRSFDWYFTSIYDEGVLYRWENALFLKDRRWGGIGPYVQLLSLPRAGKHVEQWAFGLNATARLGLVRDNDLLYFTFLIRPGDDQYGQHAYFAPIRSLLVYRLSFDL